MRSAHLVPMGLPLKEQGQFCTTKMLWALGLFIPELLLPSAPYLKGCCTSQRQLSVVFFDFTGTRHKDNLSQNVFYGLCIKGQNCVLTCCILICSTDWSIFHRYCMCQGFTSDQDIVKNIMVFSGNNWRLSRFLYGAKIIPSNYCCGSPSKTGRGAKKA